MVYLFSKMAVRRLVFPLFFLLGALVCSSSWAIVPQAGQHYQVLKPEWIQDTELAEPNSVWVIFWYGCPACERLEDELSQFQARYPEREWQYKPIALQSSWRSHAKAFYIARHYLDPMQLHRRLYQVIGQDKEALSDGAEVATWFGQQGYSVKQAEEYYRSKIINQQLQHDTQLFTQMNIENVPAVVVGGQYLLTVDPVGGWQQFSETLSHLLMLTSGNDS